MVKKYYKTSSSPKDSFRYWQPNMSPFELVFGNRKLFWLIRAFEMCVINRYIYLFQLNSIYNFKCTVHTSPFNLAKHLEISRMLFWLRTEEIPTIQIWIAVHIVNTHLCWLIAQIRNWTERVYRQAHKNRQNYYLSMQCNRRKNGECFGDVFLSVYRAHIWFINIYLL